MSKSVQESSTDSPEPPISVKVVEAIADAEDATIGELDPIYDHVDLDALEALVSNTEDLSVKWSMNGHWIEVDGTGTVHVT